MWAAAAAAAFNLICSGTMESGTVGNVTSETYTKTYRVDLAAKVFCEDECKARLPIRKVQPTVLVFKYSGDNAGPGADYTSDMVDRQTGEHTGMITIGAGSDMISMKWTGKCERAPFTGWPKFRTKF